MAIAIDQQAANNSAATTVVNTITATAAGALLVACVSYATASSNTITGVTDSAGNTWTALTARFQSGTNSYCQIWYSLNAASVTSVTATGSSSSAKGMNVSSWTPGAGKTWAFEQEAGTGGAASTTMTASTVTTVASETLVIKAGNHNGSASAGTLNWTGGTALTKPTGTSTGQSLESAWKTYASVSTNEATTWTITSGAYGTATAVFKTVSSGTSISPPAATATAQAFAPTIDTTLDVPAATVTAQAFAPTLATVSAINPPTATATAQAFAPTLTFAAGTIWPPEGRFSFVLCDSDGDFQGFITRAKARTLTYQLNGIHTCDITLSLDDALAALIEPGLSRIKVYRLQDDGTRVLCFYGTAPAHTVKENAVDSTMSMTFMDPRWALQYRYIHKNNDLLLLQPGESITGTLGDTFAAFLSDATNFYGMAGGSIWISFSGSYVGPTDDWPVDERNIYDQLTDFTVLGVDWDISFVDYFTSSGLRQQGDLEIFLTQGSDLTTVHFIYGEDLPSNVSNMTRTYTAPITYATVTGTDPTSSELLTSSAGTPDDATYGALESLESAPDVRTQAQLDSRAQGIVDANAVPRQVIDIGEPLANAPKPFTDYYIGDTVYCSCRKGSMIFNKLGRRVHVFKIDIGDTGYETVSLTVAD